MKPAETDVFDTLWDAAGGPTALARKLNVRQSVVSNWKARGQVPAEWVLRVEAATGVSRSVIRADLYPTERAAA